MDSQTAFQLNFDFLTSKPIVVELSAAQVSSDAGLFPFRQLDEQIGLTRGFAEPLTDRRDAGRIGHSFLEMVRMRVYGILAGYPDQNDHDVLRSDPVCKLICDRSINDDDLEHVVDHSREAWPAVLIHLRGDSGKHRSKSAARNGCKLQRAIVGLLDGTLERQVYAGGGGLATNEFLEELQARGLVKEGIPRKTAMFTVRRACHSLLDRGILEGEYIIDDDYPWARVAC